VAQDTTANLLGQIDRKVMVILPERPCALPDLPHGVAGALRDDGAMVLTYRAKATPAEAVLAAVRNAGVAIRDVRTEEPHLEDVFLALTSGPKP
jgi:ABC-2 type transport system ATP-binding protein